MFYLILQYSKFCKYWVARYNDGIVVPMLVFASKEMYNSDYKKHIKCK